MQPILDITSSKGFGSVLMFREPERAIINRIKQYICYKCNNQVTIHRVFTFDEMVRILPSPAAPPNSRKGIDSESKEKEIRGLPSPSFALAGLKMQSA